MASDNVFKGNKGKFNQLSYLTPGQQPTLDQLQAAAQGGQGGAFGQAADHYRSLLDPENEENSALFTPEIRRFQEQTIPQLAEQFSGYGGLGSSDFQNAATRAGSDLSERLAALRAQLRSQGAEGLQNIGRFALQPFQENVVQRRQPGFLESAAPGIGSAATQVAGGALTNYLQSDKKKGSTSPYGNIPGQTPPITSPTGQIPKYNASVGIPF